MTKFIGFKFPDNDFHSELKQAVEYVAGLCDAFTVNDRWLKDMVIASMYAYHLLKNVSLGRVDTNSEKLISYLAATLTVLRLGTDFIGVDQFLQVHRPPSPVSVSVAFVFTVTFHQHFEFPFLIE